MFHGGAGAGEVDAHEVVAGGAEGLAVVEGEAGFMDELFGELFVGEVQPAEVDPQQVGGLVLVGAELGQVLGNEILAVLHVVGEVVAQLVEPVGAVGVGGQCGDAAEDVAVDMHCVVHERLEACAEFGVGDDDLGGEHTGEVEGFARRHAGDGVLRDFVRQGGDGCVLMAAHHQVGVNFVADEQAVVLQTEFGYLPQLLRGPAAAHGVVGVADNHQFGMLLQLLFQIVEVHLVVVVVDDERVENQFAPIFLHHFIKRRIDGGLDENFVVFFGKNLHHEGETCNDARREADPLGGDVPLVALLHPCDDGLVVGIGMEEVAHHGVFESLAEGIQHKVGGAEVHVGNPHRQHVLAAEKVAYFVVFQTVAVFTGDDFVEVVFRHRVQND